MPWRYAAFAIILGAAIETGTSGAAEDVTPSWYPFEPGDTWIYQKESRDGYMAHPSIERWTTEETIASVVVVPDVAGTLITKRTKVLDHTLPRDFIAQNDSTKREVPESHVLIHQNCLYVLDGIDAYGSRCDPNVASTACLRPLDQNNHLRPEYRDHLLRGKIPPDFCFPIAAGKTWGRVPATTWADDWVWHVSGVNADPFGPPGGETFHMTSHFGSGTRIDRWFAQGVGVVQEVSEHHGTYDEHRRQLLRSTIHGKMTSYQLSPARTIPLSDSDCNGPGWQHYSRADGNAFSSLQDCIRYSSNKK
jgi:hypothetical protein